jgi:hypothetical protein
MLEPKGRKAWVAVAVAYLGIDYVRLRVANQALPYRFGVAAAILGLGALVRARAVRFVPSPRMVMLAMTPVILVTHHSWSEDSWIDAACHILAVVLIGLAVVGRLVSSADAAPEGSASARRSGSGSHRRTSWSLRSWPFVAWQPIRGKCRPRWLPDAPDGGALARPCRGLRAARSWSCSRRAGAPLHARLDDDPVGLAEQVDEARRHDAGARRVTRLRATRLPLPCASLPVFGSEVQGLRGPAAVSADERRTKPLVPQEGPGRRGQ